MSILRADDLAYGYRGRAVGSAVTLAVGPGEVVALLGANGCGKTTLFKTLLGLLPARHGSVSLDGQPLARLSRRAIARRIAYVPQAHDAVFPYSVEEMVLMGRTAHRGLFRAPANEDLRRAREALAQLGIASLAARDYTRISGGQRQLALVARALAQDTSLIVMDEPTASLDFGNQVQVLEQVVALARRGPGLLLSTHDPGHALACASRVLVMHDGRLVADGEPRSTLTPALLREVYGVSVRIETLADGQALCAPVYRGSGAAS